MKIARDFNRGNMELQMLIHVP